MILRRVEGHLGVPLLGASRVELEAWWDARLEEVSARSASIELANVRAWYQWAVTFEHRADDPTGRIRRPRYQRCLPRPIPEPDLVLALDHAPERVRPMLLLAAYAGLRACEIAGLRGEHLSDEAVFVADGKGGRQRIVPMHPKVAAELVPARSGWVFPHLDGRAGPVRPHRVSHLCNGYLHAIGLPQTLHQLRHRFGTETYRACSDIRVVQELMGHADPATTAGYAAHSVARAAEAVRNLS